MRARVRHEPDRSGAVLVEGPDGEALVAVTRQTGQVRTVAREGAARLFGVPVERIAGEHLGAVAPRPPCGREGQRVRVVSAGESTDPEDWLEVGTAGQACWIGPEAAWLVVLPGFGAGPHPSEHSDFEPVVGPDEVAALEQHLRPGESSEQSCCRRRPSTILRTTVRPRRRRPVATAHDAGRPEDRSGLPRRSPLWHGERVASTVVLVDGLPGAGKTTLAQRLKEATGWPLLSKDAVKEALALIADGAVSSGRLGAVAMDAVWSMAAAIDGEVVVESWWFRPRDLGFARAGVDVAGAARVVEVWCDVDPAVARGRCASRHRAAVHDDGARLTTDFDRWAAAGVPLGIGPVVRVGTSGPVDVSALVARVREAASV